MIKISLDEGYVFDMLAILDVKKTSFTGDKLNFVIESYNKMSSEIIEQISEHKYIEIIESKEYKDLFTANKSVFDLVDKTKIEGGLAKLVDDANFDRYLKKQALQSQFFMNEMKEVKDEKYISPK
jgi:hypothetical protein